MSLRNTKDRVVLTIDKVYFIEGKNTYNNKLTIQTEVYV
jgi:hypothetical protein